MDSVLNLELRSEVLNYALHLEKNINILLVLYLNLEKDKKRALTKKSGGIPFRSKIDLLFDIGVLDSKEWADINLIMEFRNAFMHNIDCSSFSIAVDVLNKRKELMKFADDTDLRDDEFNFVQAYRKLNMVSLQVIMSKVQRKSILIREAKEVIAESLEWGKFVIKKDADLFDQILEICDPHDGDTVSMIEFKTNLSNFIQEHYRASFETEEYKALLVRLQEKLKSVPTVNFSFK